MGDVEGDSGPIPPTQRRGIDRLTDAGCRAAKADGKLRKLSDGKGLYLAVTPEGSKLWRVKYRHGGKERVYSIGPYDEVSLADARKARDKARALLRDGIDPTIQKRVDKSHNTAQQAVTFGAIAEEWLERQSYSPKHRAAQRVRFDTDLLPYLGALPITEITPAMILETLRRVERRGVLETAAKCRRIVSQVFRYAAQTARATNDPARLLVGALKAPDTKHRATVPLKEMPTLLKTIRKVPAELTTRLAIAWLLLTAARTGEMRLATWGEIEDGKLWRIPAARMKSNREHVVPLSKQARQVLKLAEGIRTSDDDSAYLFPGFTRHGALSENALLALLARAGYFGRQTSHGFRASFSTWAHEVHEADPDIVEACLAHVGGDVRAVYNRSAYLTQRAKLLQAWADQLTKWGLGLSS